MQKISEKHRHYITCFLPLEEYLNIKTVSKKTFAINFSEYFKERIFPIQLPTLYVWGFLRKKGLVFRTNERVDYLCPFSNYSKEMSILLKTVPQKKY